MSIPLLYRAITCIVSLVALATAAPDDALSFELRTVLPKKEGNSELMRFGDEMLHVSIVSILTTDDFLLKHQPVTGYSEIYEGVRAKRFGVNLLLTKDGRTKLRKNFKKEESAKRGAFVLNGKIIAVPVIRVVTLTAEDAFSLPRESKNACERLVRELRRAKVKQQKAQGEEPNAG